MKGEGENWYARALVGKVNTILHIRRMCARICVSLAPPKRPLHKVWFAVNALLYTHTLTHSHFYNCMHFCVVYSALCFFWVNFFFGGSYMGWLLFFCQLVIGIIFGYKVECKCWNCNNERTRISTYIFLNSCTYINVFVCMSFTFLCLKVESWKLYFLPYCAATAVATNCCFRKCCFFAWMRLSS